MKIAILGDEHNGVSNFINYVLVPALFRQSHEVNGKGFEIREAQELTIRVAGPDPIRIATFATPLAAADWLHAP